MQSFLLSNLGPDLLYLWQGLGRWGAIKYPRWQHLGSGVRQRNGQCLDLMVLFGIYFSHILNRKTGHKRPVSICYLPWQCRKKNNILNILSKLKGIIEREVLEYWNVPHYNSIFPTPYLGVVSREYIHTPHWPRGSYWNLFNKNNTGCIAWQIVISSWHLTSLLCAAIFISNWNIEMCSKVGARQCRSWCESVSQCWVW